MKKTLSFRYARPEDTGRILFFIKELAAYEKMSDLVSATRRTAGEMAV